MAAIRPDAAMARHIVENREGEVGRVREPLAAGSSGLGDPNRSIADPAGSSVSGSRLMRWRRRSPDQRPPGGAELTRRLELVADSEGHELAEAVAKLRDDVERRAEPSLGPLILAADDLATLWLDQRDRLVEAIAAVEAAIEGERAVRQRLRSVLDLLLASPPLPNQPSPLAPTALRPPGPDSDRLDTSLPEGSAPPTVAPPGGPRPQPRPAGHHGAGNNESVPDDPPALPYPEDGLATHLFGRLRLAVDGEPVETNLHGKALRVFRYLLANKARPAPKDVLIDTFWPNMDLDSGRRSLHQAVYTIRKALPDTDGDQAIIVFENDAYQINPRIPSWSDVGEFELSVRMGRQAEADGDVTRALEMFRLAESLVTGEFVEEAPYEDWTIPERERLRLAHIEVADHLADLLEATSDPSGALEVSQRILRMESTDERSHRRVMRCYIAAGQRTLAIRQYEICAEQLQETYRLAPSQETVDLFNTLIES